VTAARPRLAFVGPLPPVRSGIADYARDLLPHIAADFDVEVFVDDRQAETSPPAPAPIRPASELRRRFGEFRHVVYQLGNNLHHRFVLELAREIPGIVVLHDLVLHHLYEEIAGVEDEWESYGEALRESYGEIGDQVVRWKRWRLASERENFALPLFESLAAGSRGVLVHSRSAETEVRRRLSAAAVRRITMGIPEEPPLDRDGARRRLGVPPEAVIIGAFGFITPIKRLDIVAAALRSARSTCPELRLVLVGEASPGARLEEIFTAAEFGDGRVIHRGYVAPGEYRDWMAATDVAVNLRYPSAGETSASLLRLLGDGKCTLVSAYRQFLEIPSTAAVWIPLGREEEASLASALIELACDSERRLRISEAARAFVAAEHSMVRAARDFREAVETFATDHPVRSAPDCSRVPTSRAAAVRGSIAFAGSLAPAPKRQLDVELEVRNEGRSRWIATPDWTGGHVGIGGEVRTAGGFFVARVQPVLPDRDLAPGEKTRVRLRLRAPAEPGEYWLQPTIVHFGRGGSQTAGGLIRLVVVNDIA
jgi:glycosyltransferase involved in cell wall biosynthesis